MLRTRRFVAFVCFAVLIAIAMAPLVSDSPSAVLVLLTPLFGAVESAPFVVAGAFDLPSSPTIATLSPRAPPVGQPLIRRVVHRRFKSDR
jgi:hypothetical protein